MHLNMYSVPLVSVANVLLEVDLFDQLLLLCMLGPSYRSFRELLKDPEHMEHFHSFLMEQGSSYEMQLLFWLAVEDMKSSISNKKACTAKMKRILKRFFGSNGAEKGTYVPV